ncbi:MAG: zinc ribbon domain-containing protein [Thermomicrobiales bacterium]
MTEREGNEQAATSNVPRCPACGAAHDVGDRFCAQCGAVLTSASGAPLPPLTQPGDGIDPVVGPLATPAKRDATVWLFGATPLSVIGGGLLLLLFAVVLLAVGQLDHTGTIVMASICLAPLAFLTLIIGVVRLATRHGNPAPGEK